MRGLSHRHMLLLTLALAAAVACLAGCGRLPSPHRSSAPGSSAPASSAPGAGRPSALVFVQPG